MTEKLNGKTLGWFHRNDITPASNQKVWEESNNMIDLKTLDEQQLNLLIHNCNVYGVKNEIKQKYIDELKSRNKE